MGNRRGHDSSRVSHACGCFRQGGTGPGDRDRIPVRERRRTGGDRIQGSRLASGQGGAPEYVDDFYNAVNHVTLVRLGDSWGPAGDKLVQQGEGGKL